MDLNKIKNLPNPIETVFGGMQRRLSKVQFKQTTEQRGIIEAVLVVDSVLCAIIRKVKAEWDVTTHANYPLFNNHLAAEDRFLSPAELLIPITNIDLAHVSLDPKTLIGKYVTVSVVDGSRRALKAEYIGGIDDPSQSPFKVLQNVLYNARMLAGATATLTEQDSKAKEYLTKVENINETNLALINMSLDDWKGKVVRIKGDATYHNDTDKTQEFEIVVESEDFLKNANKTKMKTKNCHLPITIFSAR